MIVRLLRRWLGSATGTARPLHTALHGMAVRIEPLAPHLDATALAARLDRVLALVDSALPGHVAAAAPHVATVVVRRFPCRGAFVPGKGELVVELTFLADPSRQDGEIGATIVHEMEHARLRGSGEGAELTAAEEERRCRMMELQFGERIPGGDVVLARARAALALDDENVAPTVDWDVAWRLTNGKDG